MGWRSEGGIFGFLFLFFFFFFFLFSQKNLHGYVIPRATTNATRSKQQQQNNGKQTHVAKW